MGSSEGREAVHRPQAGPERRCPSCGQPVGTVLKRHKILGAWAPVWEPGPCRDPHCERYAEPAQDEPGKSTETG
ncbi:hypothetical protein ACGF5F_01635 [Streptomyces sp. NPDC047821]|uniref:hypothetical protein n=1 Tax=Streptomyces sp. NPDC047821 TaxID=3365488 RepID=UPI003715C187